MQIIGGWPAGAPRTPLGEIIALPIKLAFSKTAHLEMPRLQNGLLRHSSIPRTPEKN